MNTINILGVKIDVISKQDLLQEISDRIQKNEKTLLYTVNNEFVVEANKNPKYKEVLNNSTISVADSTGIVWAAKKLFKVRLTRLPGADLFSDLIKLAASKNMNIFLLGGDLGVGRASKAKIESEEPTIGEVDFLDGEQISLNEHENEDIIYQINSIKPQMVFVALGSPKQELWIDKFASKIDANLFIGIGGTLDFYSGEIKRAPRWMRKWGLEWLYRLLKQPSRFGRIYRALVVFPYLVSRKRT